VKLLEIQLSPRAHLRLAPLTTLQVCVAVVRVSRKAITSPELIATDLISLRQSRRGIGDSAADV
jgi:hypothetical protein